MKKYPIGFNTEINNESESEVEVTPRHRTGELRKSVVQVYFPHRGMGWAYYNDSFDLKVGDFVYVEGKLEGYRGQVTEVNYSFKIKLSDYKKVIAVIDTDVKGDFFLAGPRLVSFDRNAIPFSKVITWFKSPEKDEEYVIGDDYESGFSLDNLNEMNVSPDVAEQGYDYLVENRVLFLELDGTSGRAIVEGSKNYEIEFSYEDGKISNLKCSCFCSGACKHGFAAMLLLKETLELITLDYKDKYDGYFATISKGVFMNTVMGNKATGKISLGN